jgi:hypothetical protein
MLDYISCNLTYYKKGNGKGDKKYSNTFKILFYSIIEYIRFKREDKKPVDELQLKRREKRNKERWY